MDMERKTILSEVRTKTEQVAQELGIDKSTASCIALAQMLREEREKDGILQFNL